MLNRPIYLDNHATTPVDPQVLDRMLPYFHHQFGNAGSSSHAFGQEAKAAVAAARAAVAAAINANPREIVFTSGATESNNLALRGVAEHPRRRGNHIISVVTEHKAVLDPLARLQHQGFDVTLLPVIPQGQPQAGQIRLDLLAQHLRPDTLLVSVMLANNEIGTLQPLTEIAQLCRQQGVTLHTDATQAVGKIPVDVQQLGVDLMSFSAHKLYGPKGVGALFVRRRGAPVRLAAQISGGGQETGLRSGTLNVPGIVGLAAALSLSQDRLEPENQRVFLLRQRLADGLLQAIPGVTINGPQLSPDLRLNGNLNCAFHGVEGEAVMLSVPDVAVSSGSACTTENPEPSHVLRSLGLGVDDVRSSLRFGIGRFNTPEEIDFAILALKDGVARLRRLRET